MVADWSDKDNWVIAEFLNALNQPNIPYYPLILGGNEVKVVELPSQLSPPAILPAAGKKKFIEAIDAAING